MPAGKELGLGGKETQAVAPAMAGNMPEWPADPGVMCIITVTVMLSRQLR